MVRTDPISPTICALHQIGDQLRSLTIVTKWMLIPCGDKIKRHIEEVVCEYSKFCNAEHVFIYAHSNK
jgi:hypothetical protein